MTLLSKGYQKINRILPIDFCRHEANQIMSDVVQQQAIGYDYQRGWCWQIYNPEPMQQMHKEAQPLMEEMVGEKLFPTYSYVTAYTNNSYMAPHVDRESCEISVSINLASSLDWKLFIRDLHGVEVELSTTEGDGIAYLGTKVRHWRDVLISNKPEFYIQTFFHYVRADGKYAHLKNDASQ